MPNRRTKLSSQQLRIVNFVKERNLPPAEAGPILGVETKSVHAAMTAARSIGMEVPRVSKQTNFTAGGQPGRAGLQLSRPVDISTDILRLLRPAAAKRGLSDVGLARQIIEAVAEGGLVDAVLDDAGGVAA